MVGSNQVSAIESTHRKHFSIVCRYHVVGFPADIEYMRRKSSRHQPSELMLLVMIIVSGLRAIPTVDTADLMTLTKSVVFVDCSLFWLQIRVQRSLWNRPLSPSLRFPLSNCLPEMSPLQIHDPRTGQ